MSKTKNRCTWCTSSELYISYHDEEWGVPVYDDRLLFEMLLLEGAQAGLSWITILNKREKYRKAFDNFDAKKIACYTDSYKTELLQNPGIVRNKLKVNAAVTNAQAFLKIQKEERSFSGYIWQFVEGKPIKNSFEILADVPASTPESDTMAKDLKKRGFKFVGSIICYAFMQAVGMVNDHTTNCFRHNVIDKMK